MIPFVRLFIFFVLSLLPVTALAQEAEKPPVDWVDVESTGVLSTAVQGAMEKTLWKGQPRTQIEYLIRELPDLIALRSVLSLQRRLLLSKTDSSLIDNDVGPLRGKDLLIQRINKLMDMGLYDDAWNLYTQKAEDPYDVSIAQLGMLLLVMKNDLATACLEEKVFASKYPEDEFFKTLDHACSETLGTSGGKPVTFDKSAVLHSVYNDKSYSVSAKNPDLLNKMTDLERALVLAKGRIKYDGLTKDILAKTPSALVSLYLMDRALPDSAKTMIKAETDVRGLTPYIEAVSRDETYVKAKSLAKDPDDQWPIIESALTEKSNPADLAPYASMISSAKPANLSTGIIRKVLDVLLASGKELPPFWLEAARNQASNNPLFYIYLKTFESLTPTRGVSIDPDLWLKSAQSLKPADFDQIIAIIESLDKDSGILNNPIGIYEKHLGLTLASNYVMPTVGLNILLETAPEKKQIGITALAVLNGLYDKPDNMYSGTVRKALYSMLNVGLIEDAKLIGAETVATVLNKY